MSEDITSKKITLTYATVFTVVTIIFSASGAYYAIQQDSVRIDRLEQGVEDSEAYLNDRMNRKDGRIEDEVKELKNEVRILREEVIRIKCKDE